MQEVNIKEARINLSKILDKVENGQEIILTRRGKQIAHLVSPPKERRLPSLQEFRQSLQVDGLSLSSAVLTNREEERY